MERENNGATLGDVLRLLVQIVCWSPLFWCIGLVFVSLVSGIVGWPEEFVAPSRPDRPGWSDILLIAVGLVVWCFLRTLWDLIGRRKERKE